MRFAGVRQSWFEVKRVRSSHDFKPRPWLTAIHYVGLLVVVAPPTVAQNRIGPAPTDQQVVWRVADADCNYHLHRHRRETVRDADQPVELIRVTAGNGTHIRLVTALEPVRIVDETELVLPIKADRRRLQLLARVVLPRTKDPDTGAPITILVRGPLYDDVNNWQRLTLNDIPRKRDEAARALRLDLDSKIDVRESYVDLLGLNIYGGLGTTTVRLAAAEVDGQRQATRLPERGEIATKTRNRPNHGSALSSRDEFGDMTVRQVAHVETPPTAANDIHRIRTDGSLFFVDGRPTFIRMIEHQGENFAFLKQLGFNAVRLPRTATDEELALSARHGVWLVCPPPNPNDIRSRTNNFERVIAWDLGDRLATRDFDATVRRVHKLRSQDHLSRRPLLAGVDSDLHAYSDHLDILLHDRAPLGTSLPLPAFGKWLSDRPRLTRPTVIHWAAIQTDPLPTLEQQWGAFRFPSAGHVPIEATQVRHVVFAAVAAGVRGLYFRSRSPLQAEVRGASQNRAATVQLINAELDRIEPWVAGGKPIGTADTDDPNSAAYVLHTARGQLVCVMQTREGGQYVPSPTDSPVTVTIPGVPVAHEVYRLSDAGLKSLTTTRVAGGTRIVLDDFVSPAFVLLTRHPLVVNSVSRRATQRLHEVARLRHHLANDALVRTQTVARELELQGITVPSVEHDLERARSIVRQARTALDANQSPMAADLSRRATAHVADAQRALWTRSTRALPSPVASPLCTQLDTLPWHWHLVRHLPASRGTSDLLKSGDFEGPIKDWQSLEHAPPDVSVQVGLVQGAGYAGGRCLRLRANGVSNAAKQSVMESSLVWVNSPSVTSHAHQIIKIQGVVNVPTDVVGSSDGVMIFDSLGGPELGYRVSKTNGWEPFVLYRAAENRQSVSLTVALTGLGEVLLDNIVITPVVAVTNVHSQPADNGEHPKIPTAP